STTSVTTDINPSTFSQNVKITATVIPVGATGRPSFFVDGNLIGTAAVNGLTGLAVLNVDNMLPGVHCITVSYPGDSRYLPSASAACYTQGVEHKVSTTALSSTNNPSLVNTSVDLIATIIPSDATGTVEFFEGATSLGTSPVDDGGVAILSKTF